MAIDSKQQQQTNKNEHSISQSYESSKKYSMRKTQLSKDPNYQLKKKHQRMNKMSLFSMLLIYPARQFF